MKQLIFINGPMGVGKSTVCQQLYRQLPHSVWLDGDWCWTMHPFLVTDENKRMVEDNILYLLGNFLRNGSLQHVIFSWVMHQEAIAQHLLGELRSQHQFEIHRISLVCSPEVLRERLLMRGTVAEMENSVARLPLYRQQDSWCLDTSGMLTGEVVDVIVQRLHGSKQSEG